MNSTTFGMWVTRRLLAVAAIALLAWSGYGTKYHETGEYHGSVGDRIAYHESYHSC